ncbi:MAG: biopolymer transporter ExbD [Burkholderiales bacterium]|nr:biopolymer transporter ExbD [Burkholderiales bacterium]
MSFGRLERPRSAQPISEINVTPLVDVMLVLVVIFILTAPLLTSAIKLDLPQSAAAKPAQASRALTLVVDRAGQIFLADQPITPERLAQQLRQAAQANPDTELRLRADAQVPYGRIVEVMGVAHQAGLHRIGFVADPGALAKP